MHRIALACFVAALLLVTTARAQEKQPAEMLDGPPLVTAKAWVIAEGKSGAMLWGGSEKLPLPMASTTKMMTAWVVLKLAAEDEKVLDEVALISERSDKTSGSTAAVEAGEQIPIRDLLYGLLLPSGNDAAVALAEHFGSRFPAPPTAEKDEKKGEGDEDSKEGTKEPDALALFTAEMNRRAEALGMKETKYLDPHGLSLNRSSARDLALLASTALRNQRFRDYVSTSEHHCQAKRADGTMREAVWKNTNQLLKIEGYDGVKTGTTTAAGACLVASGRRGEDHLLVVVLGATSPDARYVDARNLFRWAWGRREQAAGGGR